ncbi:MAG: prolyl oligopeptidase family serine peptidase [Bacillota bacterium]|jgi:prolyl oligopeptidase
MITNIRRDNVVDDYHGIKVADPFRWMEDPDLPETKAFVAEQNARTFDYLNSLPMRPLIKQRITELWNYPKQSAPFREAGRYYVFRNDGLQNQSVLYRLEGLEGDAIPVLDPNRFSDDGTVALTNISFSHDGRLLAYSCSQSGSDWQQIRVVSVDDGQEYPDLINWCKFTTIAWLPDDSGFFYTRFPEPGSVPPEDASNYSRVCLHRLGTDQSADQVIYERPDHKQMGFRASITEDHRFLVLHITLGTNPENRVYYRRLDSDGPFIRLLDDHDAMYHVIGSDGDVFYVHTNWQAPKGRVMAVDLNQPERENWRQLIAESEDVIDQIRLVNECFVVTYLRAAYHRLAVYHLDGSLERIVQLPTLGTVEVSGKRVDKELFVSFTSYLYPTTVFRYDFDSGQLSQFWTPDVDFDANQYETRQVFYPSKDGTQVPMFLTHKKGLPLDGNNPTLLYGYGGYNLAQKPNFSVSTLVWLEHGGVYAVAGLRGGNEFGEEWHRAGMLEKKQNVFDDFIAAAEWLIANGYTRQERLAIQGRSNGGLLTAACMIQRPDLYGAVISWVPVIDMLRFHRFTAGRYWTGEYGDAELNPDHFRFMIKYSPLHNVKFGTVYPPVIILTAESDDRVVPMHSKKFAATLQAAAGGDNPVYLRVESKAGHGAGKPTAKLIDEQTDIFSFLFDQLQVK